jgi:hypothetical protein
MALFYCNKGSRQSCSHIWPNLFSYMAHFVQSCTLFSYIIWHTLFSLTLCSIIWHTLLNLASSRICMAEAMCDALSFVMLCLV